MAYNIALVHSLTNNTITQNNFAKCQIEPGDIVLIKKTADGHFGNYDIGRVENVIKTKHIAGNYNRITDVITDASAEFIAFSIDLKKQILEKKIQKRIEVIDNKNKMSVYAEADENIKNLIEELNQLNL